MSRRRAEEQGESRGSWQEAVRSSRGGDQRRGGRRGQTLVSLLWKKAQHRLSRRKRAQARTLWSTAGSPGSGDVTCS